MSVFDTTGAESCRRCGENARAEVERLQAENTKLREELAKARDPQRISGQADPSSFVYAIEQLREFRWQHATNDEDAIPYINNVAAAHERENEKLREQGERLFDKTLELGTENAKLRERVAELEELTDEKRYIPQEWYQLATAENAQLRGLVCMMAKALGIGGDWCSADCYATFNCGGETCPVADRMAELGIEVNE